MVSYTRTYSPRPCIKCDVVIEAPRGPQRYCETCRTTCDVEGCANAVRANGRCTTHLRVKFPVPSFEPIAGRCGVEGCGRELKQKGLCTLHYGRAYHYGDVGAAKPREGSPVGVPCLVDGCDKPSRGRGYCATHYQRFRVHGDAGSADLQRRAQGEGYVTPTGYLVRAVDGVWEYEHRRAVEQKIGRKLLRGENVHHVDGDKLNNDPSNLELWSDRAQPSGQRVVDKVRAAISLLRQYPEVADEEGVSLIDTSIPKVCKAIVDRGYASFLNSFDA